MAKYENSFNPCFEDGSSYKFVFGSFDPWCVEYFKNNEAQERITDEISFKALLVYGKKVGYHNEYEDFVEIYNMMSDGIDETEISKRIEIISEKYEEYKLKVNKLFHFLFMCMIAEDNKKRTVLGKRIKRLGVHRLLIEGISPKVAANETKHVKSNKISNMCTERGF